MATGDLKNNLMKLLREIRRMKIEAEPDVQSLSVGSPSSFLSLLHAAVMHYSLPLANWFTHHGYDLYGRSDLRFLQELYRVLRDVFHYHPKLTKEQFLSSGFSERKVLMTRDILLFCQAKHDELANSNTHTTKRKWRPSSKASGNHGSTTSCNHGNTIAVPKKPGADVLTIQDRAGIGSVWMESDKDYKVDEPLSPPPNMTPPPLLRRLPDSVCSKLDVTPLPKQLPRRVNTSPIRLNSSLLLQSSTSPPLSSSPPHLSSTPPLLQSGTENPLLEAVNITTHVVRHESPKSNQPQSHFSIDGLSSSSEESSGSILTSQREDMLKDFVNQEAPHVKEVGSRVEELTRVVENLTAKIVLLENQLKLSPVQTEGRDSMETGDGESRNAVEKEKVREEEVRGMELPLRDITKELLLKQPHHHGNCQQHPNSPLQQTCQKKPAKSKTASEREASHLSSGGTQESSSKGMLLSSGNGNCVHRYTSPTVHHSALKLDFTTPSTPEETKKLIQSLRVRAKETKDFLQLANSRLVDFS